MLGLQRWGLLPAAVAADPVLLLVLLAGSVMPTAQNLIGEAACPFHHCSALLLLPALFDVAPAVLPPPLLSVATLPLKLVPPSHLPALQCCSS